MVVLSFVKYGNIHNAINFTFSIPCDAYLHIFYGLLHTFSSGPLRFCQQKHFSSYTLIICGILQLFVVSHILYFHAYLYYLYPQTKVGDILDSGPSRRRRRRRRNFLVDAITQKQINIFFSNLVHMLRVPKGRSLF